MARNSKSRVGNSKERRFRNSRLQGESGRAKSWVGSSLLSAIDKMDGHVNEMLLSANPPSVLTSSATVVLPADSLTTKRLMDEEVAYCMEHELQHVIDAAIVARMGHYEALSMFKQPETDAVTIDRNRRTLNDLDKLHRHERTLNETLVERLFNTSTKRQSRRKVRGNGL